MQSMDKPVTPGQETPKTEKGEKTAEAREGSPEALKATVEANAAKLAELQKYAETIRGDLEGVADPGLKEAMAAELSETQEQIKTEEAKVAEARENIKILEKAEPVRNAATDELAMQEFEKTLTEVLVDYEKQSRPIQDRINADQKLLTERYSIYERKNGKLSDASQKMFDEEDLERIDKNKKILQPLNALSDLNSKIQGELRAALAERIGETAADEHFRKVGDKAEEIINEMRKPKKPTTKF